MRISPAAKAEKRAAIIAAAGRRFRLDGMSGLGVDALAKAAGQTSGAVYAHFAGKAEVFRGVVEEGLARLQASAVKAAALPGRWAVAFAGQYLSLRHRDTIADGCLLPSLSADVARADGATREAYADGLEATISQLAQGCAGRTAAERRRAAIALLALSAGGVTLSRAVPDGALAEEILAACRRAADTIADAPSERSPHER